MEVMIAWVICLLEKYDEKTCGVPCRCFMLSFYEGDCMPQFDCYNVKCGLIAPRREDSSEEKTKSRF